MTTQRPIARWLSLAGTALSLAGCLSQEKGAAIATTSAVVIGGTLAPVGEALDAMNPETIERKRRWRELAARYDTVYQERTILLAQRNAFMDAGELYRRNLRVFLPLVRDGAVYVGLKQPVERRWIPTDNAERLRSDPDAARLLELTTDLPDVHYLSPVYEAYQKQARAYQDQFNFAMLDLVRARRAY